PVTRYSPEVTLPASSRWRAWISRMRASSTPSISLNCSSVISPSSRRIWAASSSSRYTLSSFSSASTASAILRKTNLMPPMSSVSRISSRLLRFLRPLQLEPDVDEVVGRPRSRVAEGQLVVGGPDLLHARVEHRLLVARDEEGGVHDHLVADGLVGPGGHAHVAQALEDLVDVVLGAGLQGAVHQPSVLHAREGGRALLGRDLALEPPHVLVLVLDLAQDDVAVPQDFQPELELVLHLVQHVVEGAVGPLEELDDVVARLEHRAEGHRDDRVLPHDGLVHALVG